MVDRMYRRLFFIQLIISSLATLGSCIDSILTGRFLGATALAATGLISPIIVISSTLSDVLIGGIEIVGTKSIAKSESDRANRQVGLCMVTGALVGALIGLVALFFTDEICVALGTEYGSDLFYAAQDYARGLALSVVGLTPVSVLMYVCRTNGDMKRCKIAGVMYVGLNIVFDLVAIFLFPANLFGLGCATSLSTIVALVYLSVVVRKGKGDLCPVYNSLPWADLGHILYYGCTRAAYKASYFVQCFLINSFLLHTMGATGVAAYAVARSVYGISSTIVAGLYSTTTLVSSIAFGEENREALCDIIKTFVKYGFILGLAGALLNMVIAGPVTWLYLDPSDPAFALAVTAQRLIALQLPFSAISVCFQNFYVSGKHIAYGVVLTILIQLVFVPSFLWAFWFAFGASGAWVAFPCSHLASLLCLSAYCALRSGSHPFKAETFLMVPEGFGPAEGQQVRVELTDRASIDAARTAIEGMEVVGRDGAAAATVDPARRALVMSYMEEIASIMLDQAERCGGGLNVLRASYKDDEWVLSFWSATPAPKSRKERLAMQEHVQRCSEALGEVLSGADNVDHRTIYGFGRTLCRFPASPADPAGAASPVGLAS